MTVIRFGAVPNRRRCSPNMDGDEWADDETRTDAKNALFEQRCRNREANLHAFVSWEEAKLRLMAACKR